MITYCMITQNFIDMKQLTDPEEFFKMGLPMLVVFLISLFSIAITFAMVLCSNQNTSPVRTRSIQQKLGDTTHVHCVTGKRTYASTTRHTYWVYFVSLAWYEVRSIASLSLSFISFIQKKLFTIKTFYYGYRKKNSSTCCND